MVPAVQNHQYDTAAFGVLVTPEREAVVDFTTPIGYGQAQLVSRKNAPLETIERADGKTVAVTTGSALIPLLQKIAPKVTIKEFPNIASSTNALLAGQVDGLFTGNATAAHLVELHPELTAIPDRRERHQRDARGQGPAASCLQRSTRRSHRR